MSEILFSYRLNTLYSSLAEKTCITLHVILHGQGQSREGVFERLIPKGVTPVLF